MRQSVRVLVVEADANARRALLELLRDEGFDVEGASNGAEALAKTRSNRPHIVITDDDIATVVGTKLPDALAGETAALRLLVMSARPQTARDVAVVAKPVDFATLVEHLRHLADAAQLVYDEEQSGRRQRRAGA